MLLLIFLFGLLAFGILGRVVVTLLVVIGAFVSLGLLTAAFSVVAWLLSRWPVPDPRHTGSLLALLPLLLLGLVLLRLSPGFGSLLLALVAVATVVAFVPRTGRASLCAASTVRTATSSACRSMKPSRCSTAPAGALPDKQAWRNLNAASAPRGRIEIAGGNFSPRDAAPHGA